MNIAPNNQPLQSTPPRVLELDGVQRTLYDELQKIDPLLARMYHGALDVLQSNNPDKFALSAHGIREMMEKLPEVFGEKKIQGSLGNKAHDLHIAWERAKTGDCYQDGKWDGMIEPCLRKYLQECSGFFSWLIEFVPKRTTIISRFLHKIDGGLPSEILKKKKTDTWKRLHNFFQTIAHHGKNRATTLDEFKEHLGDLETMLLDGFCPQTFADFDAIDGIIRMGETS